MCILENHTLKYMNEYMNNINEIYEYYILENHTLKYKYTLQIT